MSASIYYFSGTGNSYRIAKAVSSGLEDAKLINIAAQQNRESSHTSNVIGIVFPLYYFGLPVIVENFLRQLNIPENSYVFIIVTRGVSMAGGAKRQLDTVFHAKSRTYHFFRYITMGNNYPFHALNGSTEKMRGQKNQKADEKVAALLSNIRSKKRSRTYSIVDYPPFPAITLRLPIYGYRYFLQKVYKRDSCFVVDETLCNKCKKCERACPVDNVEVHSKVVWKHESCEVCLACYNCCPQNAVQYIDPPNKVSTHGKRQYWNFIL